MVGFNDEIAVADALNGYQLMRADSVHHPVPDAIVASVRGLEQNGYSREVAVEKAEEVAKLVLKLEGELELIEQYFGGE